MNHEIISANPASFSATAHGRVNLIGEHTDYNGGWVLPTAIPQSTRVVITPRSDRRVCLRAQPDPDSGQERSVDYTLGEERKEKDWADYIRGATVLLAERGFKFRGFTATITSSVPEGSGLSSSAALEMSFLHAMRTAFQLRFDDLEKARFGQAIENDFVGARIGIMDQMACSFASAGEALFLDTRDLNYERVALPPTFEMIVINSGLAHQNSGGDYNQRRAECEEACTRLEIHSLRDLGTDGLARIDALPEPFRKRARHVFTENARVHKAVAAIRAADPHALGRLFYESHQSMRDDYAVSISEIDILVDLCREERKIFGARLTGGGFGGSIVAICEPGEAAALGKRVSERYARATNIQPTLLVPEPSYE